MSKAHGKIIIAYGSVPKDGGTYTFYRNIRPQLLRLGIDMRCVSIGRQQARLWDDAFVDEGCILLEPYSRSEKKQAMAFDRWCAEETVDIVIGVNSAPIISAIDHLPESIRVISRCANAFDHGYRITMSGRERLAAIIATSPRLESDLIEKYGADPEILRLIPNGIAADTFLRACASNRGEEQVLQIGFLGRLEHNQKGVGHIPGIVRELNQRKVNFRLRIAGKGKHQKIIEQALEAEVTTGQVEFLGAITPTQVPDFLGSTDVFLFTSHFEGCPNALLEALMAGCVPVSWRISGITDYIINHNHNGFLSDVGDYSLMGSQIENLANDRPYLRNCSANAANEAGARFNSETAAEAYAAVFHDVMSKPPPHCEPKNWQYFRVDPNFSKPWAQRIVSGLRRRILRDRTIEDLLEGID